MKDEKKYVITLQGVIDKDPDVIIISEKAVENTNIKYDKDNILISEIDKIYLNNNPIKLEKLGGLEVKEYKYDKKEKKLELFD